MINVNNSLIINRQDNKNTDTRRRTLSIPLWSYDSNHKKIPSKTVFITKFPHCKAKKINTAQNYSKIIIKLKSIELILILTILFVKLNGLIFVRVYFSLVSFIST